jgi:hypothetical protein
MKKSNTIRLVVASGAAVLLLAACRDRGSESGSESANGTSGGAHGGSTKAEPRPSGETKEGPTASEMLSRWDETTAAVKGPEQAGAVQAIVDQALGTLAGAELGEFIVGLEDRRAGDRVYGLIGKLGKGMFTGKDAAAAREWLCGAKAGKAKDLLCYQAGYHFTGPGLKDCLMAVVVGQWAGTAPDAAEAWLEKAPAGSPRDVGMAALARHWLASDPAKAWQYVIRVTDPQRQGTLATEVFKIWEQSNRQAAGQAWFTLYPQQSK